MCLSYIYSDQEKYHFLSMCNLHRYAWFSQVQSQMSNAHVTRNMHVNTNIYTCRLCSNYGCTDTAANKISEVEPIFSISVSACTYATFQY